MSFHWNLSSDDDDDDGDDDDDDDKQQQQPLHITHNNHVDHDSTIERGYENRLFTADNNINNEQLQQNNWNKNDNIGKTINIHNDDNDNDSIDWEDAVDSDENDRSNDDSNDKDDDDDNNNRKPAAIPNGNSSSLLLQQLKPITIDMDQRNNGVVVSKNSSSSKNTNKKRRRNLFRIESFASSNPTLHRLLWDLHYTHLLTYACHAVHLSNICSHNEFLHIAYSLIPQQYHPPVPPIINNKDTANHNIQVPTYSQMVSFVNDFYFPFVHTVVQRRQERLIQNRNAGAPPTAVVGTTRVRNNRRQRQQQQQQQRKGTTKTASSVEQSTASNHDATNGCKMMMINNDPSTLLRSFAHYLSSSYDEDPQLLATSNHIVESTSMITNILRSSNICSTNNSKKVLSTTTTTLQHSNTIQYKKDLLINGLLLAMIRSMGWRARIVYCCEPISPDLTVDHPILKSYFGKHTNLFTTLLQQQKQQHQRNGTSITKRAKVQRREERHNRSFTNNDTTSSGWSNDLDQFVTDDNVVSFMWIEILCCNDNKGTKNDTAKSVKGSSQYRWYQLDPIHRLIDQPNEVEALYGQRCRQQSATMKKSDTVSYVISVEHYNSKQQRHPVDDNNNDEKGNDQVVRVTDVTPRYARSWISSLKKRGLIRSKKDLNSTSIEQIVQSSWWSKTLHRINNDSRPGSARQRKINAMSKTFGCKENPIDVDEDMVKYKDEISVQEATVSSEILDQVDHHEKNELAMSASSEAIPTSKAAFKTHPLYVIPSELGKTEVLHPDAKQRVCGVFKGQLIYRRSDVTVMRTAKKWLYEGRKVRDDEINSPINTQTKRKKPTPKTFKALTTYGVGKDNDGNIDRQIQQGSVPLDEDDTDRMYGIWQTDAWSPEYVGANDDIPLNEYKNVELALLNPGLVHIDQTGLSMVAKKLGIPYAPCLLGFEGHGGNRTPTIRGIVVHEHNEQIIREAAAEVTNHSMEQEHSDRRRKLLLMWKRLMVGVLTKDRLEREYGDDEE